VTITEFLTARYDEEEAQARSAIANRARAHVHPGDKGPQTFGPVDISDDANLGDMAIGAEYVLADVAAKRAIVKFADVVDGMAETIYQEFSSYPDDEGADLLKILVQPYADHPDFDPAWRVA
jgi:hypothetical protein